MSRVVRKLAFCICEKKDADQLRGNREAGQRLCFRYTDIQSLYFLNTKCQASSHLLCLYRPVYVRPGQKPLRQVFSQRGSYGVMPPKDADTMANSEVPDLTAPLGSALFANTCLFKTLGSLWVLGGKHTHKGDIFGNILCTIN